MSGDPRPFQTMQRRLAIYQAARRLGVGDAVPTARAIARALGVSHTAALAHRRAALADAGMVVRRGPSGGIVVVEVGR